MKFETARVHFLSDVFDLLSSTAEILPPLQLDVTTSLLVKACSVDDVTPDLVCGVQLYFYCS